MDEIKAKYGPITVKELRDILDLFYDTDKVTVDANEAGACLYIDDYEVLYEEE